MTIATPKAIKATIQPPINIAIPATINAIPCKTVKKFSQLGSFIKSTIPCINNITPANIKPMPKPCNALNPNCTANIPPAIPVNAPITISLLSAIHCNHPGTSPCIPDKSILGDVLLSEFEELSPTTFISSKPANDFFISFADFADLFIASALALANKFTPNQACAI